MATPLVPTVAIPLRDWAKTFTRHHLLGMSAAIDGDTLYCLYRIELTGNC